MCGQYCFVPINGRDLPVNVQNCHRYRRGGEPDRDGEVRLNRSGDSGRTSTPWWLCFQSASSSRSKESLVSLCCCILSRTGAVALSRRLSGFIPGYKGFRFRGLLVPGADFALVDSTTKQVLIGERRVGVSTGAATLCFELPAEPSPFSIGGNNRGTEVTLVGDSW